MIIAFRLSLCVCAADGESANDRHRSMGEVVWPGLQFPGGRRRHRCGGLPLLCCPGWPHRSHEASPSSALLRILYTAYAMAVITHTSYISCILLNSVFDTISDITPQKMSGSSTESVIKREFMFVLYRKPLLFLLSAFLVTAVNEACCDITDLFSG